MSSSPDEAVDIPSAIVHALVFTRNAHLPAIPAAYLSHRRRHDHSGDGMGVPTINHATMQANASVAESERQMRYTKYRLLGAIAAVTLCGIASSIGPASAGHVAVGAAAGAATHAAAAAAHAGAAAHAAAGASSAAAAANVAVATAVVRNNAAANTTVKNAATATGAAPNIAVATTVVVNNAAATTNVTNTATATTAAAAP
jgi:hypothetical protein